ncbi:MAG: glycosyltransferase [Pseudomonadota bacterium]
MSPPPVQLVAAERLKKQPATKAPVLRLVPPPEPTAPPVAGPMFRRSRYVRRPKLGEILTETGTVGPANLAKALLAKSGLGCRLGDALLADGGIEPDELAAALGKQYGMGVAGPPPLNCTAADALARQLPPELCLRHKAIPWRRNGDTTLIATADPAGLDALQTVLPASLGRCRFAMVPLHVLHDRIAAVHGDALARAAECRVPERMSCRAVRDRLGAAILAVALLSICLAVFLAPGTAVRIFTLLGLAVVTINVLMRFAAFLAERRDRMPRFVSTRPQVTTDKALPKISILVPLHNEPDIAEQLTQRLSRLDYPRALLEVALVVEAEDRPTRDALDQATLPPWMRVIAVPDGQPRTKPRAMNYALSFVSGDIIGVYDAEDAPAPDQLRRVATRFAAAPSRVACLQGCLDYYNPTRNWMARCFTIEYAGWFRQMLPGIARMGLVVPLGGTTLFFRRAALERVGAWDAHNVTEDADLGVRLARMGYRTEILPTTTLEEANAAPIAWVKQRSRWIKGYLLTWAVHTRHPIQLWRDLGPKRFFGLHLLFLGAVLNAIAMPVLWSLILIPLGLPHPITAWLNGPALLALGLALSGLSLLHLSLMTAGCHAPHHRALRRWVPTMALYAPLASLAVVKALIEIVLRPFHWDKTAHGNHGGTAASAEIRVLETALVNGIDRPAARLWAGGAYGTAAL